MPESGRLFVRWRADSSAWAVRSRWASKFGVGGYQLSLQFGFGDYRIMHGNVWPAFSEASSLLTHPDALIQGTSLRMDAIWA